MKKFFFITLSILILSSSAVVAKEFKSKNGYLFQIPKKHKVIEKNMMKLYEKHKDNEFSKKTLDQEMFEESSEINVIYLTWIIDKKEKEPGKYNISITASKEVLLKPVEFIKEWCPEFEIYFDQMFINKKINLHVCEKKNLSINNVNTDAIKFVYDFIHPNTLMYQYTTIVNNHSVNIAGSCLEKNCNELDQNLISISSSFRW